MEWILIPLIFFAIAALYSSVGFGGGSSYLAVLNIFAVAFVEMRFIALACNIVVVSGSVFHYQSNGLVPWKKLAPLIALSVPLAFVGGMLSVNKEVFLFVLGISLCIAGPLVLIRKYPANDLSKKDGKRSGGFIGGGLGFLSGLVGIGGGIFLSPVLHLMKWDRPKVIAATASVFILVNSISGMIGQLINSAFSVHYDLLFRCLIAVFVGGQLGVRMSVKKGTPKLIRAITAILVTYAGVRIIFNYFA